MTRRTRTIAALSAFVILAGACGSTSSEPAAEAPVADAPAEDVSANDGGTDTNSDTGNEIQAAESDEAPVESPAPAVDDVADTDTEAGSDEGAPAETDAPTETDADAEPATPAAAAWPDDGCSTDGSPTPTDAAEAPAPTLEVRAESADSLLPPVPVRRVNCNGGWVNFQNELPSAQPLLVWFWAPH